MFVVVHDKISNLDIAKDTGIADSGFSRSMSSNRDTLDDFVDFDGGPNFYTFSLEELAPQALITCLLSKASQDESNLWHRRLGHVNFRNMNKLVKGNLIRGLPNKMFPRDQTCIACNKGKQHKASYKGILLVSLITTPLHLLYMDLFGPTSVKSITNKYYCLVIVDEFTRFSWVFFLTHKNETYRILEEFITLVENQFNHRVKYIRCDNGTEFKNANLITLCATKGIKRDYSNARTPQQNRVSERKNRTLIEAAQTMLADSLSTNLSAGNQGQSSNNVGYQDSNSDSDDAQDVIIIQNSPTLVTTPIHDVLNHEEAAQLGLAFPTHVVSNEASSIPAEKSSSVSPASTPTASAGNTPLVSPRPSASRSSKSTGKKLASSSKTPIPAGRSVFADKPIPAGRSVSADKPIPGGRYVFADKSIPAVRYISASRDTNTDDRHPSKLSSDAVFERFPPASNTQNSDIHDGLKLFDCPSTGIFSSSSYDDEYHGHDISNHEKEILVNLVTTKKVNEAHPHSLIIRDLHTPVQTRKKAKAQVPTQNAFVSYIQDQRRNNHTDFQLCLFSCFLSQTEPTSVAQALLDPDWVEAMKEELQQFQNQKVWVLVELPEGKHAIGTKWILKNKRDAKGIVCRNKARLVAQGHRQEEGINYTEVFAPIARVKAIRLFLAFASYIGFMVYQMDVKSAFLNGKIQEEVYVTQPKGFEDPKYPKRVYKVVKALYGLHQAPRAWSDGIFIHQTKYVNDILHKFDMDTNKSAPTPFEPPKIKDTNLPDGPVNVHLYRSMIRSLMYLIASRPHITFVVSACTRNQVSPTVSNLNAVKRIFKYIKGHPKLGLWYPRDSPFDLEAFSDSDYAGAAGDTKSTTGGCQIKGRRLIS
nr:ribonuclease H-like domain-containing protein [Tanacetum cinerariifolium]